MLGEVWDLQRAVRVPARRANEQHSKETMIFRLVNAEDHEHGINHRDVCYPVDHLAATGVV